MAGLGGGWARSLHSPVCLLIAARPVWTAGLGPETGEDGDTGLRQWVERDLEGEKEVTGNGRGHAMRKMAGEASCSRPRPQGMSQH